MSTTEIATFTFADHQTRVIHDGDRPVWIASDLADMLGYSHAPHMLRMLDEDQKGVHKVDTLGGIQEVTVVTESGMWTCVIRSNKPEAKRFVRILTEEILPALRRQGFYALPGVTVRRATASVAEFMRVGQALKKERNRSLRADLWARLDQITDSWGIPRTERAIGYDAPDWADMLLEFWGSIRALDEAGTPSNQSRRNDLIALHLPTLRRTFADVGIPLDIDRTMMDALRNSVDPRFLAEKPVNCGDGKIRHCWVFSTVPQLQLPEASQQA